MVWRPRKTKESLKDHLDEVTDAMKWINAQPFDKPLVHIIDREADSIGHIRQWEEQSINWLTRSRITSGIEYQSESMQCSKIVKYLSFTKIKKLITKVSYAGMDNRNSNTNKP